MKRSQLVIRPIPQAASVAPLEVCVFLKKKNALETSCCCGKMASKRGTAVVEIHLKENTSLP